MEQRHRVVDTGELLETYRELLPQVDTLPLVVSGSSMTPFLVHGRDTVHIAAVGQKALKVGDIVLYQRDNKDYILHRVQKACKGDLPRYNMIGDAHTIVEKNIRRDQIFGIVKWVDRKGKREEPGTLCWDFFAAVWVRIIPLRPCQMRGYAALQKLLGRNKN